MHTPSNEQQIIIDSILNNNIIVDAVAGAGKTTCILHIALKYPDKNILHLTYNKKLRMETKCKVDKLGISNLETHTYHSFAVKYYDSRCITDNELSYRLPTAYMSKSVKYDYIILDEAQDMSELYYKLVKKIYIDSANMMCSICILGDFRQSIYDFNNADSRFIKYAEEVFNINSKSWVKCDLSVSYRVNSKICNFINTCLYDQPFMNYARKGKFLPKYVICNTFDLTPYTIFINYILKGTKPSDIFILAPSIRSVHSPVRKLENNIKNLMPEILIYVPNSDEENLDNDIIKDKLVFSTFHQAKGLERKIVFVFGFDDFYFDIYKSTIDKTKCPNELYVACTRASDQLILFHNYDKNYLTFLNKQNIKKYTLLMMEKELIVREIKQKDKCINATDLVRHLPFDVVNTCLSKIRYYNIKKGGNKILIDTKIEEITNVGKYYELVSDITGTAIPMLYEMYIKKNVPNAMESIFLINNLTYNDIFINNSINIAMFLKLTNLYMTQQSGYIYKYDQIKTYNWLSESNIRECFLNLDTLSISQDAEFEKEIITSIIIGRIDCIDNNNLYEFKCTNALEDIHLIQLAIYAYIYNEIYDINMMNYYLYNILTDELITINLEQSDITGMIQYLLKYKKSCNNKICSDKDFIKKMKKSEFPIVNIGDCFIDDD